MALKNCNELMVGAPSVTVVKFFGRCLGEGWDPGFTEGFRNRGGIPSLGKRPLG